MPSDDRERGSELSLAEHVCLALIAEEPRHGWALVKELDRDGPVGAIWSLSRALTYRAVEQLKSKGLIVPDDAGGDGEASRGPSRVVLQATPAGRDETDRWLAAPVHHIRDLRTEFLVKATLSQRGGGDVLGLLDAQESVLLPVLDVLGNDDADTTPVGVWRRESARSAQRFFAALRASLTGVREPRPAPPVLSRASPDVAPSVEVHPRQEVAGRAAGLFGRDDVVVARSVELRGFGTERPGEIALVADGELTGRLLGGALDDRLRRDAGALVASGRAASMHGYTLTGAVATGFGLTCGGSVTVLLQRLRTVPALFWSDELGVPRASVTRLDGGSAGATLTVTQLGERAGSLGDPAADDLAADLAAAQMRWGIGGVVLVDDPGGRLLVDVVWSVRRLVVVGLSGLATALERLSVGLGWSTYLCDAADEAVTYLADALPSDALVVLTHDPAVDVPVLVAGLRSRAGYVGALGSRSTQGARRRRLADAGLADDELSRLHGPAGLDLGASGPPEIAVSIVAEIIATRSGRRSQPLAAGEGPIQNRFRTV